MKTLNSRYHYLGILRVGTVLLFSLSFLAFGTFAEAAVDNQPNPDAPGGGRSCGGCGGGGFNYPRPATGYFDGVNATTCSVWGWAYDPDNANTQIDVHIYKDARAGGGGTFLTSCTANTARPDVNQIIGIPGNHGFSCTLPASYVGTGIHSLWIHAIDSNGSPNNLLNTNGKVLNCAPPPAPTLSLAIAPSRISAGSSANLSWTSSNATSCTASGAWTGGKSLSGLQNTGPIMVAGTRSYTLTCSGAGGTVTRTVPLNITGSVALPSATISGNGCTIPAGGATCSGSATWDIDSTAAQPNVYSAARNVVISNSITGSGVAVQLNRGANPLQARSGTNVLAQASLTAACASGTVWSGSSCVPSGSGTGNPPSITANNTSGTIIVRSGSSVVITWNTNLNTSCTLSSNIPVPIAQGTYTVTAQNTSTYTIDCGVAGSDSVTVKTAPATYES